MYINKIKNCILSLLLDDGVNDGAERPVKDGVGLDQAQRAAGETGGK